MHKQLSLIIVIILFWANLSIAQSDSALIYWQKLTHKDIEPISANDAKSMTVQSLNRREEVADALPYTMFIIRKEEIRQMGYSTLVDVLKRIPGVKISKNGSAILGEMFSVRGQLGNQSMKVMINGIPITNSNLAGITIGAQLPIKDAEQIEIIFNNTCTQGLNTVAGTINIVTIQSDRPAYTSASIKYGSGNYSEINTFFGGKFGRGKKIFNFSVYGNFTTYDEHKDNFTPENYWNFNPSNYLDRFDSLYMVDIRTKLGNLDSYIQGSSRIKPHTSQSIGAILYFRNFQLSYDKYKNKDHSSLGYQPAAVSDRDPSQYLGQNQDIISLKWKKEWKKLALEAKITRSTASNESLSSITYVHPIAFKKLMYESIVNFDREKFESNQKFERQYFSDKRYLLAVNEDNSGELNYAFKLAKNIQFNGGFRIIFGGNAYSNNYGTNSTYDYDPEIIDSPNFNSELGSWMNAVYQKNKLYLNVALMNSFFNSGYTNTSNPVLTAYRISGSYQIFKKNYLYLNTSKSNNIVPVFYIIHAQRIIESGYNDFKYGYRNDFFSEQSSFNHEIGIRGRENLLAFDILKWKQRWILEGQMSAFISKNNNLIDNNANDYLTTPSSTAIEELLYKQDANSFMNVMGVQYSATIRNFFNKPENYVTLSGSYSRYNRKYANTITNYVAEIPNYIMQLRISYMPIKNFTIVTDFLVHGRAKLANINETLKRAIDKGASVNNFVFSNYMFPKTSNLDLLIQYRFSSNFQVYLKVTNILEKEMMGLSNIVNPNDNLFYVPQSRTMSWIGLNYTLD